MPPTDGPETNPSRADETIYRQLAALRHFPDNAAKLSIGRADRICSGFVRPYRPGLRCPGLDFDRFRLRGLRHGQLQDAIL